MKGERGDTASALPVDWADGTFVGRILTEAGPSPILVVKGQAFDMAQVAPTVAALIDRGDFSGAGGVPIADFSLQSVDLISPVDLQCVKACGVTFAVSALERVIEERGRGDPGAASAIRERLEARVGGSIRGVVPGTPEAAALKQALIDDGLWSQYLEVAIGPDAEVFTKAPVLATVGADADIGIRSDSTWNNPEPEIALLVDNRGKTVGAMLGNDVNLRDFEGRSALLLGKAKDNNASCSLGPLVRLFDDSFTIDDVRTAQVALRIGGEDGYVLEGASNMAEISRDPLDLVGQAIGVHHAYPDGLMLFLGTMFAPTQDRHGPGQGFTHVVGDRVRIAAPELGALVNRVAHADQAPRWTFGIAALMRNLAGRGLL